MVPAATTTKPCRERRRSGVSTTIESWARDYLLSCDLSVKSRPGGPPPTWEHQPASKDHRPGRPPELKVTLQQPQAVKSSRLPEARVRAELMHKFWHHELQAAELMAWALLRFVDTPQKFRQGLVKIQLDEIRHMALYEAHIKSLGYRIGDFAVRDWMWQRVSQCTSPVSFVALLGIGLEGANLDHAERFARRLRVAGDEKGACIQEQIAREEIAHVSFAAYWFKTWTGDIDFETWRKHLPPDLTPLQFRGKHINQSERLKAKLPQSFLNDLQGWKKL